MSWSLIGLLIHVKFLLGYVVIWEETMKRHVKMKKIIYLDISAEIDRSRHINIQTTQRTKKSWKRHEAPQQRAREELLNYSCNLNINLKWEPEHKSDLTDEEEITSLQSDRVQVDLHQKQNLEEEFSSNSELTTDDTSVGMDSCDWEEASSRLVPCSKRHPDRDPDGNPKPSKVRRQQAGVCRNPSYKYSIESFCGVGDHMPDGFYDAGCDQQFMLLEDYEHTMCQDSGLAWGYSSRQVCHTTQMLCHLALSDLVSVGTEPY
jgi:hypothetical protein